LPVFLLPSFSQVGVAVGSALGRQRGRAKTEIWYSAGNERERKRESSRDRKREKAKTAFVGKETKFMPPRARLLSADDLKINRKGENNKGDVSLRWVLVNAKC
jgi:hypothetical protein